MLARLPGPDQPRNFSELLPPPASPMPEAEPTQTARQYFQSQHLKPRSGCWEPAPNMPFYGYGVHWLLPLAWFEAPMGRNLWSLFCFTLTLQHGPSGYVPDQLVGWETGSS